MDLIMHGSSSVHDLCLHQRPRRILSGSSPRYESVRVSDYNVVYWVTRHGRGSSMCFYEPPFLISSCLVSLFLPGLALLCLNNWTLVIIPSSYYLVDAMDASLQDFDGKSSNVNTSGFSVSAWAHKFHKFINVGFTTTVAYFFNNRLPSKDTAHVVIDVTGTPGNLL
jgi:hypothetical protein